MKKDEGFPVAIKVGLKHGILVEALEKRDWSQKQGADFLGINQTRFGLWINMKCVPRRISETLAFKLMEFTGRTIEELWPEEVFTPQFLAAPKALIEIRKVPTHLLANYGLVNALPPTPSEIFALAELRETVREALDHLPQSQYRVLNARYVENMTLEEAAQSLGKSRERIRQIEMRALRNLRKPYARNKKLHALVAPSLPKKKA